MLVGEERNLESKTASFFCVDQSGTLWSGRGYGEGWWTGIETVHRGLLYLHGYATPDLPGKKGIIAVDCATGDLLWKREDLVLLSASGESVYARRDALGGPFVVKLESRTGNQLSDAGRGEEAVRNVPRGGDAPALAVYPLEYGGEESSPASLMVKDYSSGALSGTTVEYAEHGGFVVIVRCVQKSPARGEPPVLLQTLHVVSVPSGKEAMYATLDRGMIRPAAGSFIIMGDTLFFVRERRILCAVPLGGK